MKNIIFCPPTLNTFFKIIWALKTASKNRKNQNSLNFCRSVCLISLPTNMLEGWDIIHLKSGIHSSVWSTKTFLYNKREPRYK